ncbi:MAG: tetratricopeptide repeat protein [Lachnospiraceae bacterium]|nr:tetratricopeptide repeat protein [Lachnospiraceae bacterium]
MKSLKKTMGLVLLAVMLAAVLTACSGKKASDYNKEGMKYYDNGDYDRAEEYLKKATDMDKGNKTFTQNYAMIMIQQSKLDMAIDLFTSTLSTKDSKSAKKNNKYAYRGLGMAYMKKKDYAKAIENFDLALGIDIVPEWNTDIKYYKANAALLSGNTDLALQMYTEILESDPENGDAYEARAKINYEKGFYASAVNDYNNALLYKEKAFEIYIGLAASCLKTDHQKEADEALFNASLLDIKSDMDKFYLGVVHYYQKKYSSAKPEMQYALKNGIEDACFYLAEMEMMDENYDKAKEYFERYLGRASVESPAVCNDLACCCIYDKDYEKAMEWIEKGLSNGTSGVTRDLKKNEIVCLEQMGKLQDAKAKLETFVLEYPEDEAAKLELEYLGTRTYTQAK